MPPSCLIGDINDDGLVSILDAIHTLRAISSMDGVPNDLCTLDTDGSGGADIVDLVRILMLSL